jgi:hypothetical protein
MDYPESSHATNPIIKEPKKKASVLFFRVCLQLALDTPHGPTYHSSKFAGKGTGL